LKVGSGKRTKAVAADGAKENDMEMTVFEKIVRIAFAVLMTIAIAAFVAFLAAVQSRVLV